MPKIWTNSGDSHFLEPADLWESRLPRRLAGLTPKAEKDPDGEYETVRVDGQTFRRKLPTSAAVKFLEDSRKAEGIRDDRLRLGDLDHEGVWGEVIFPSLGMWASTFRTPELLKACMRASNEWALEEIASVSDRYVVTAQVSTLAVEDAVAELEWAAARGFKAVFLPTRPHPSAPDWHAADWEPFWQAAEQANMVLAIHIGTDVDGEHHVRLLGGLPERLPVGGVPVRGARVRPGRQEHRLEPAGGRPLKLRDCVLHGEGGDLGGDHVAVRHRRDLLQRPLVAGPHARLQQLRRPEGGRPHAQRGEDHLAPDPLVVEVAQPEPVIPDALRLAAVLQKLHGRRGGQLAAERLPVHAHGLVLAVGVLLGLRGEAGQPPGQPRLPQVGRLEEVRVAGVGPDLRHGQVLRSAGGGRRLSTCRFIRAFH